MKLIKYLEENGAELFLIFFIVIMVVVLLVSKADYFIQKEQNKKF